MVPLGLCQGRRYDVCDPHDKRDVESIKDTLQQDDAR